MMQFVTEWFDFEESEKASCDWSENKVVDCENRFHENLVMTIVMENLRKKILI